MKISQKGIDLIKEFEGYRSQAYLDSGGLATIGYGTTRINGVPVQMGMTCTREEAEQWLYSDMSDFEVAVGKYITVELNQNEFDALVCFTYNVGSRALSKSTLRKKLNLGDRDGAAEQFKRWNKVGKKVVAGLTRRRLAESILFSTPFEEPENVQPTQSEEVYVEEVVQVQPQQTLWASLFTSVLNLFK